VFGHHLDGHQAGYDWHGDADPPAVLNECCEVVDVEEHLRDDELGS
jgi:hypothetical protein